MNKDNKNKLTGIVTMEDSNTLEIEIDDQTRPKLLLFPKLAYPYLKGGDMVIIHLEKVKP